MDKRFVIIHNSEIVRKGLWAILRESFHQEFILLKEIDEIGDYSGISSSELLIFIDKSLYSEASKDLIERILVSAKNIVYLTICLDASDDCTTICLKDDSAEIARKVKLITEKKEEQSAALTELSDREKDVLVQVALGLTNKEIADKLFISIHTVITHRKHITDKLGIKSISGLTVYAILNKLIDTENIDPTTLI